MSAFADAFKAYGTGIGGIGQLVGGVGSLYSGLVNADIAKKQIKMAKEAYAAQQDKEDKFQSNLESAFINMYGG